jgi:hypothetical protein
MLLPLVTNPNICGAQIIEDDLNLTQNGGEPIVCPMG